MGWVVGGAWIGAAMLALVVFGFCAYELVWKSRRLSKELQRLTDLTEQLGVLQADVTRVQDRLAETTRT